MRSLTEPRSALRQTRTGTPIQVRQVLQTESQPLEKVDITNNPPTIESEASSDDEDSAVADESLADRIAALKDIVPPTQRKFLSNTVSTASSWLSSGLSFSGKTLWVVSTSVLLLGVPWAMAFAEEQQLAEMEREMKMQQSANEVR